MLTRKEAEEKIARSLAEIRETLANSEPWNEIPESDRIFNAGGDGERAWLFVLRGYGNEVIDVHA